MSDSTPSQEPFEQLEYFRSEARYQTTLIANRTNAFLASQSFLMIAYGISMGNTNERWGELFTLVVPVVLASLGTVNALNAWPGLQAAYEVIEEWHERQDRLTERHPELQDYHVDVKPPIPLGKNPSSYRQSLLFSLRSPWIFVAAWTILGGFAIFLHYR